MQVNLLASEGETGKNAFFTCYRVCLFVHICFKQKKVLNPNSARHSELVTHSGGTLFYKMFLAKAIFREVIIQQEK